MPQNVEARAVVAHRRASETVCVAADLSEVIRAPIRFQMRRLLRRFDSGPERPHVQAELIYASAGRGV
ncbi:hypothetical protein [Methylobacterium oryzisoli]|uniref:hypothetical protein n=1 Tax=Methylobacterium oryzisoli TaxID=3385502 RepID=UPI0038912D2C